MISCNYFTIYEGPSLNSKYISMLEHNDVIVSNFTSSIISVTIKQFQFPVGCFWKTQYPALSHQAIDQIIKRILTFVRETNESLTRENSDK